MNNLPPLFLTLRHKHLPHWGNIQNLGKQRTFLFLNLLERCADHHQKRCRVRHRKAILIPLTSPLFHHNGIGEHIFSSPKYTETQASAFRDDNQSPAYAISYCIKKPQKVTADTPKETLPLVRSQTLSQKLLYPGHLFH